MRSNESKLFSAIFVGDINGAQNCLSNGVDVNSQGRNSRSALMDACCYSPEIARLLLAAGADPGLKDMNDGTALHGACAVGFKACVQHLLSFGADLDAQDRWGRTPLMVACAQGHHEIVQELMAQGANDRLHDNNDRSAIEIANESGFSLCAAALNGAAGYDAGASSGRRSRHAAIESNSLGFLL